MLARLLAVVRRHPLVTFFGLAYAISWGSFLILSGPFLFPFGPFLAAITVASLTRGKAGLKDWLRRCLRWRVGLKWYAAALAVPVAIGLATVSLNILLGAQVPTAAQLGPWYSLFLLFPIALIDAPLGEDSGWRGYALPRFPAGRSRFANTIILGVLLAGWHLPLAVAGGALATPFLIATFASAVVTNWVYYNSRESALLAILYHTAANTMGLYFRPMLSGPDLVQHYWLLAAVNCVVAIGLVIFDRKWLSHRPAVPTGVEAVPGIV